MEVAGIKVAEIGSEVKVVGVHKLLGVYQQGTPDGKHQTSWAARLCQPHRWRQVDRQLGDLVCQMLPGERPTVHRASQTCDTEGHIRNFLLRKHMWP
mmetsp:Transcript_44492/g.102697  ORF Transcript_44492/g.102697 Transcript_44492/m.102697 type:complete len:97 (+) Transcript_44492:1101-1391(+)